MVSNPACLIWSNISRQLRAHSPCGAKALVSNPNQFTPMRCNSQPDASTKLPLELWRKPLAVSAWHCIEVCLNAKREANRNTVPKTKTSNTLGIGELFMRRLLHVLSLCRTRHD